LNKEFNGEFDISLGHLDCREVKYDTLEIPISFILTPSGRMTFLYRFVPGPCPKSYGMNVARMADIPTPIIKRAESMASMVCYPLSVLNLYVSLKNLNPKTQDCWKFSLKSWIILTLAGVILKNLVNFARFFFCN
jgi:DNA mismatch repair ATPase MutS